MSVISKPSSVTDYSWIKFDST